jgi:hypothetical protein
MEFPVFPRSVPRLPADTRRAVPAARVYRDLARAAVVAEGLRLLYLCRKALRPGAIIVVITPNFNVTSVRRSTFWIDITHQRPYPLPLLLHIFTTLGFEIVESGCREGEEERDLSS